MPHYIEIEDCQPNGSITDITDILETLQPLTYKYQWCFTHLWSIRNTSSDKLLYHFDEKIENSDNGFPCDWKRLNWIARQFIQIIDCQLLGDSNSINLKKYNSLGDAFDSCELVLCAFDGSQWGLYSKYSSIIGHLEKRFKNTKSFERPPDEIRSYMH